MDFNEKAIYEAIDARENLAEESDVDDPLIFPPYHDDPNHPPFPPPKSPLDAKNLPPLPKYEDEHGDSEPKSFFEHHYRAIQISVFLFIFTAGPLFIFWILIQTGAFSVLPQSSGRNNYHTNALLDHHINFPKAYPKLKSSNRWFPSRKETECKAGWERLDDVYCHSSIFLRNFDKGNPTTRVEKEYGRPQFGYDKVGIKDITEEQCDRKHMMAVQRCEAYLRVAREYLDGRCEEVGEGEIMWDLEGYKGPFMKEAIERGPKEVLDVLLERLGRTCGTATRSQYGEGEGDFCMLSLWEEWGIVDGILTDGTVGRKQFLKATEENGQFSAGGKKWHTVGPGRNSTECSPCLLRWFKRSMMKANTTASSLETELQTWEEAGRRCSGPGFGEAFERVVKDFKEKGLLHETWNELHSLPWLLKNGRPGNLDFPIDAIDVTIDYFKGYISDSEKSDTSDELEMLSKEYVDCLHTFRGLVKELPCYPFVSFDTLSKSMYQSDKTADLACKYDCLNGLDGLLQPVLQTCLSIRNQNLRFDPRFEPEKLPFSFEDVFWPEGYLKTYDSACGRAEEFLPRKEHPKGPVCGAIFAKFDRANWVLIPKQNPTEEYLKDVIYSVRKQLFSLKIYGATMKQPALRTLAENGVCNDCMWERFGSWYSIPWRDIDEELAIRWLSTLVDLYGTCNSVGSERPLRDLAETQKRWKSVFGEEAYREAAQRKDYLGFVKQGPKDEVASS